MLYEDSARRPVGAAEDGEEEWLRSRQNGQLAICAVGSCIYFLWTVQCYHMIQNSEAFIGGEPVSYLVRKIALWGVCSYFVCVLVVVAVVITQAPKAQKGLPTFCVVERTMLIVAMWCAIVEPWGHQWRLAYIVHGSKVVPDTRMLIYGQPELASDVGLLIIQIVSQLLFCVCGLVRARYSWLVLLSGSTSFGVAVSVVSACTTRGLPPPAKPANWASAAIGTLLSALCASSHKPNCRHGADSVQPECTSPAGIPQVHDDGWGTSAGSSSARPATGDRCSDLQIGLLALFVLSLTAWVAQWTLEASSRRLHDRTAE